MAGQDTIRLDFVTLDVFTDTRFLGNPLAVVLVPAAVRGRISQATKQRIAREFNLSETVFLHTLDNEPDRSVTTREIDIFTTDEELPFAGHPTIGSACLALHHLGWTQVDTLITKAGPIRIEALKQAGEARGARTAIPHAVHIHQQTLQSILESAATTDATAGAIRNGLSADPEICAAELAAPVVSIVKGMTFVLVRLPSLEHLERAAQKVNRMESAKIPGLLDQGEWHRSFVARYYYVPLGDSLEDDGSRSFVIRTRNIELGFEDPATGSAACTLASYLAINAKAEKGAHFSITQGVEMGRKSDIAVDVVVGVDESGGAKVKEVYLGGTAVAVMSGSVSV